MDIILDEKSIEMIHLKYQFSNSMMGSREGRIDSYSKKKKGYVDWSDGKIQVRVEKENKGINGKGDMNERVELRKDKFIEGVACGIKL